MVRIQSKAGAKAPIQQKGIYNLARNQPEYLDMSDDKNVQDTPLGLEQALEVGRNLETEVLHRSEGDLLTQKLIEDFIANALLSNENLLQSYVDFRLSYMRRVEGIEDNLTESSKATTSNLLALSKALSDYTRGTDSTVEGLQGLVDKHERLIQDITLDNSQITLDNGELRWGAWTILSQARQWDLDILKRIGTVTNVMEDALQEAVDKIYDDMPVTSEVITKLLDNLAEHPLIVELREDLQEGIDNTDELAVKLAQEEAARVKDTTDLYYANAQALAVEKQDLIDRLALEAEERVDAITREGDIRQALLAQEALDRSEEISERLGEVTGEVTQNIGAITERINSEVAERNQMISDQAQALLFESEVRAADISAQATALAAESQARRNALTAQTEALNREVTNRTQALQDQQLALSNQIVSTNASTLAALDSRATALASDYNAKVTNLNNQLTASIEDLETGVTTRLTSLEDEDEQLLQNIEAYKTSNNGNVAAIRSDLTALTTAHGTTTSKVEGLVTSFTGLDGKVTQNTTSIASEVTARSNADSALGTRIDNLTASTSDKFTEVESSITDVSEAVTSLEEATATRFTGLESSISSIDDKADTAITSAASAQETASSAVTTNTAQAEEISTLQSRLDITEGDLLTKASADVVSGIITDVSNIEGELTVQATSIEDLNASLLLVDAKAGTANTAAANAQTTANTAVTNNTATANRVNTLESNMTQVQGDLATKATASALELTNTEVTRLDGLTQTQSTSITNLSNSLVTTNSNVTKALSAVTVTDNRDTDELPLWYWQNHPKRIVNEFKRANILGVTGIGTYVNLETRVYYDDHSGGPILQRAVGATDPTLEYVRRSSGSGEGAVWTAWTQPLKAIKDDIATKASSAALSSLDSKVTDIDGRVTSQATSITELEADLTETNSLLGTVQSTAASALDTANAAVSANDAQASDITQLQAKMSSAEGTLARKADANALSSLEAKVNNNQSATTTRIDELTAAITDLGEGVETSVDVYAFNALKAEVNTAKGNITGNTSAITDLGNSLNTLDTTVHGIEQETAANANAIQDTSTQVSNIQGQVTSQGTSITNLRADLTTAQNTANNAASLAGTKADAAAFNALNTKVTNIDGLVSSQATDITEIKADITELDDKVDTKADSSALSSLTTQVGQVDGKVTTNANAITTLGGRVSEVEGQVATKAEASALLDYYTKVQADKVIAGQITSFSSSMELGGSNQLINSEAVRNEDGTYYYLYELSEYLHNFMEDRVGKEVTVSFEMKAAVTGPVAVYAANASTHTFYGMVNVSKADVWQRYEVTCQVGKHPTNTFGVSGLEFFGFKDDNRVPVLRKVQLEAGNKASAWSPSPRDYETALNGLVDSVKANTTSISNTDTEVSRIDGEVVTQGQSINQLTSNLSDTDAKAGTALSNAATAQQTANTGVSKAEAAASTANTLKATYEAKVILLDSEDAANKQAITQTNAALTSAQTTLANADTALGSRIDSLVTKVNSNETAVNSKIDSVTESVTTLTGSTNTRFDSMESELTTVSTVASDAQDAASNNSDAIDGLDSRIGSTESELLTKASASALNTTNTNLSNLEGTVTSQGKQLTTLNNSLVQTGTRLDGVSDTADTALSNANAANVALTTKADSSVVASLTSQVSGISGEVRSNSSSITELTNRVEDNEVAIGTKASSAALQALTNEVSTVKGTVTTQGQSITSLTGTVTSQGTLIGNAQTAANNAASLAGSKGKVFFQNTAPPASERLAQNLWIDTTGDNNTPKRWQTNAWKPVSDKVAVDALNAANQANQAITTKADVKAVQDLQTNLTAVDGRVTANASELTALKANLAITNSVVDTKADTSALNSLITEVTNVDDKVTANTSSITSLGSAVTTITGELADKADAALLNDYFTKAEANEATAGQIATYDANLVIGGVNQLFDSEDERGTDGSDYLSYERSKTLYNFYQANLGKPVTVSFELKAPVVGLLNVLSANISAHSFIAMVYVDKADSWTKYEVTTTPKLNNEYGLDDLMSSLEFKGVTPGLAPNVRKVQLEAGTRSTDWSPSPRDYTEAFNSLTSVTEANAQAITLVNSHVAEIDGELVSVGESITTLSNRITQVDAEAKTGITNAATAQSTADTAVSANEVTASRVDVLTTTMDRMDGDIQTKATVTAVNGLETRIDQAEESLTLQSNELTSLKSEIDTKASSEALDALSTYVSEEIEGNLTTESNRITTLTGRVDTVVGDLAKKADASALSSLTTRVETEEGKSTSQGTAITSLQNTVNHATTGLSTKASSAALTVVDNKVTAVDGKVNTTNSNVTTLSGRVSTVEGNLTTKADVSAVNALTTRVGSVEGGLSTQATNTTNLTASLAATDKVAKDALPKIGGGGSYKTFKEVLNYYDASSSITANIVIETPITFTANMFRISGKGYNYTSTKSVIDFDVSGYAYQSTGSILQHGAKNNGTFPMRIRLGMKEGKLCIILTAIGTNFAFPAFTLDATISYSTAPDTYQTGWKGTQITEANLASSGITNIIEPSLLDVGIELDANASAISSTNTEVSRIDGVVKGHSTDITNLTSSITGKADSSAVNSLTTEVARINGVATTTAASTVTLTSRMGAAENALQVQSKVVDGVKASYMVKMESNGVIGGFGLVQSTGALGQVVTSFGVNADSFFIGAPSGKKQPFIVTTSNQVVNGVTYPAGTYIDAALIANATIGNAKIADLAVTNAKIANATIESAKIKSISAEKIVVGNPLSGPITAAMVTGTSLTNKNNLFDSNFSCAGTYATYGKGTGTASGSETNYIQVDVGSTVTLPKVVFMFRGSAGRKDYIKLKASVDGTNWDYVFGGASTWLALESPSGAEGNFSASTNTASFEWVGVKPYRYLRLYGNGSTVSTANELVAVLGNASGVPTTIGSEGIMTGAVTADKIEAGSITAAKLSADVISAMSIQTTNFTATASDGSKTNVDGTGVKVYYPNGKLAIKIGL